MKPTTDIVYIHEEPFTPTEAHFYAQYLEEEEPLNPDSQEKARYIRQVLAEASKEE